MNKRDFIPHPDVDLNKPPIELPGWLEPDGTFYPCNYVQGITHDLLAAILADTFYQGEWLQEPVGYAAAYLFLWKRGWLMVDVYGVSGGKWQPATPEQLVYLDHIAPDYAIDHSELLELILNNRKLLGGE